MNGIFRDRIDAGEQLATRLSAYRGSDAIVLGMARGGVSVGFAVAMELQLPLVALVVRKLGAPHNPELAIGAVSETGAVWIDTEMAAMVGASEAYIESEIERQMMEAQRRQAEYAIGEGPASVRGRTGIVVDDGIATGSSSLVALRSVRGLGASKVVLATPTASPRALELLRPHADEIVALLTPDPFVAVGMYYEYFGQVSDSEVVQYLKEVLPR